MIRADAQSLSDLYEADETAWLDAMAELVRLGRHAELDYAHLAEYLEAMAGRERREVESRLVVLLAHVLKWQHQPEKRTRSWQATIAEQRQALNRHVGRGALRNHGVAVLPDVYPEAVELAVIETSLPPETFPAACRFTLDQLLSPDLLAE